MHFSIRKKSHGKLEQETPRMTADAYLKSKIRSIPDFPKKGIVFRDITTLLKDPEALKRAVDMFYEQYRDHRVTKVVSVESRGFIFGAALAYRLNAGFVPIRKAGKLPGETIRQEYELEYGTDAIEIHADAIAPGDRIVIHDDLLATGGTVEAACALAERLQSEIVGISFLIELSFLNGRKRITKYPVQSLVSYDIE
jgi:adenine phosphoribosyltransferase